MHRRTLSFAPPPLSTTRGRLALTIFLVLLTALVYTITPRSTFTTLKNHIPGGHPYVKPASPALYTPTPDPPASTPPPAQLIVKTKIEGEDLNWLLKLRPAWRNQVITLNNAFAKLHDGKRVDKGRIIDSYLNWIITNFENLGNVIVFIPPGLAEQEEDAQKWRIPHKEVVNTILALNVTYVEEKGYAPLRCPVKDECKDLLLPFREPKDEFRTLEVSMEKAWKGLFNATDVPKEITRSGGSAFAVSRKQIRKRSVEEYTRIWTWLAKTKMDDDSAGEVVEALWHVIFGRGVGWCPGLEECRCAFGEC